MRPQVLGLAALALSLFGTGLWAQEATPQAAASPAVADQFSADFMTQHVPALLEKAKTTSDGVASLVMHRYPGNYLNLMVRVRTGIGEMHANWSDVLVALDGEADIITGGTLVDRTDSAGGESRGTRSEGGTHHYMHKGDVLHIMPGVAHWTVLEPGKNFVFWAVKIEAPQGAASLSH